MRIQSELHPLYRFSVIIYCVSSSDTFQDTWFIAEDTALTRREKSKIIYLSDRQETESVTSVTTTPFLPRAEK